MPNNVPPWAKRLGVFGLVLLGILLLLQTAFSEILSFEIQTFWSEHAKSFLSKKVFLSITISYWQTITVTIFIIFLFFFALKLLYKRLQIKAAKDGFPVESLEAPKPRINTHFNSTDVITTIVDARNGAIPKEKAAETILEAVNSGIIQLDTGLQYLDEFGFKLIYSGQNQYSLLKAPDTP